MVYFQSGTTGEAPKSQRNLLNQQLHVLSCRMFRDLREMWKIFSHTTLNPDYKASYISLEHNEKVQSENVSSHASLAC